MPHDPFLAGQVPGADRFDALDTQGTYAPALTADTTNPNIGADGSITGSWHRNGHLITAWVTISLTGTGMDFGGTSWRVSLPFLADLAKHTAGTLAGAGTQIGNFKMRSPSGSATVSGGAALLYQLTDGSSIGKAVIFYNASSIGSLAGAHFGGGANGQLLFECSYLADPSAL